MKQIKSGVVFASLLQAQRVPIDSDLDARVGIGRIDTWNSALEDLKQAF